MSKYLRRFINHIDDLTGIKGYSLRANNKDYKVINVSPGPAQINSKIINKIQNDLSNNYSYGVTPLEMSHRSPEFLQILDNVNNKLRKFLKIPENFDILWTQGGGHGQFSAIPLNMKNIPNMKGNYLVTGTWSGRAFNESKKFIDTSNSLENNKEVLSLTLNDIPEKIDLKKKGYYYLCSNETVNGTEFREDGIPYPSRNQLNGSKLFVDMSSDLCTKVVKWNKIDMAFACTSKNLGIAGANVTIIRKDLLEHIKKFDKNDIPGILDWNIYKNTNSLYNTPAIFNIYIIEKILDYYIDDLWGIENIETLSKTKAECVYNLMDDSLLYKPLVTNKKVRSNINIPFIIESEEIRDKFLEYTFMNNIVGFRTKTPFVYGDYKLIEPLRISLYNGISVKDTLHLVEVMKNFEQIYLKTKNI